MSEERIYMFNALWFNKEGGAERYERYREAVAPLLERAGARLASSLLSPQAALIGEWDADLFFVVEYPSRQAFEAMVRSEDYAKIRHLREEALEKSLLVRCQRC